MHWGTQEPGGKGHQTDFFVNAAVGLGAKLLNLN